MDIDIHGLANIAGLTKDTIFQMTSIKDLKNIYEVNLFSTMQLTQVVTKKMLKIIPVQLLIFHLFQQLMVLRDNLHTFEQGINNWYDKNFVKRVRCKRYKS